MAYCSAGRPKASHPMGCNTLNPFIRLYLDIMSVAVYPRGCPTCSPAPLQFYHVSVKSNLLLGDCNLPFDIKFERVESSEAGLGKAEIVKGGSK